MTLKLEHEIEAAGVVFKLVESRLLRDAVEFPVDSWCSRVSDELIPAVAYLQSEASEAGTAGLNSITLPHGKLAALESRLAKKLGLPPLVPYLLDLNHHGRLDEPGFEFRASWKDYSQRPVPSIKRVGAFLLVGTKTYRIPDPHFAIVELIEQFNAAPTGNVVDRLHCWAQLRPLLPDETQASVQVHGYLRQTRVVHASSFSLVIKKDASGVNFDPILFGEIAKDDGGVMHEIESILPPSQQKTFVEKRFHRDATARSTYALDGGWYVTLSSDVRKALDIVRRVQQGPAAVRWTFARNPRAYLRAAFGDEDEAVLDSLFVETFEYSQRVLGEGLWEHPVLPWLKRPAEAWLPPEEFGLRIGELNLRVPPDQLAELTRAVETARTHGLASVHFDGHEVPATAQTLSALNALTGLVRPDNAETPAPSRKSVERRQAVVLVIATNNAQIEYRREFAPRESSVADNVLSGVRTQLKPHQSEGVLWLQTAWRSGVPGVLLADDMGLGKTLQALAFLSWRREELSRGVKRPVLIVAPTALLKNWEAEASAHLHQGLVEVLRAYGPSLRRLREQAVHELDAGASVLDVSAIQRADWVLTTYETMRDYQHSFAAVRFDTIVFDEIQKIKTPGTLMTHAAKALNGDFVIGLSGTPVENRLADLWCVVDTTYPGFLEDLSSFSKKYEASQDPETLVNLKTMLLASMGSAPPLMLRRMKSSHLPGLPTRHEHVLPEVMPPKQAQAYEAVIRKAREGGRESILQALHGIRSVSLHPLHPDLADSSDYPMMSARFKSAVRVLDEIADKGEKALVFLDSREMQRYLAAYLQRRYGLPELPMQINGAVSGPERQARVTRFQISAKGFDVMILSPRAGGVGLTLTAANHVIHLSRWWNPAVEDQCSDRIYRIGQEREVHVYYPQAVHPQFQDATFDLKLHALLEKKRRLSSELLFPPAATDSDFEELFASTIDQTSPPSEPTREINLADIDAMEPTQFEAWALSRLRLAGYTVHRTPWSHDLGADGIARMSGRRDVVIQCKHSQNRQAITAKAVHDLLRARDAYGSIDPMLVAVTNSETFAKETIELARKNDVRLVARGDLARWPHVALLDD
jgi:superfamily II DNA or RNA helicase